MASSGPKLTARSCAPPSAVPEPKEPKRAAISWSPPGELHANMHEVLFWSLLLVRNAASYGALDKWAKDAHVEYAAGLS